MTTLAESLVGKRISSYEVSKDNEHLTITTDTHIVTWRTTADCCSSTWIEGIDLQLAIGLCTAVEAIPNELMPRALIDPEHDYLQFYGIKVVTESGTGTIDFRNASNGYYGGDMRVIAIEPIILGT